MPLILVRHGQTRLNAAGCLQGRIDEPLDELGIAQAAAAAAALDSADRVVTSPLARAAATASAIASRHGLVPEVDAALVEMAYGEWDGLPLGDVPAEAWAEWRASRDFAAPGGESLAAVHARVGGFLERWIDRMTEETVVVVSHVSPIKSVLCAAMGVGVEVSWRVRLETASICRVDLGTGGMSVTLVNSTAHLDGVTAAT